ncbi:MAG: GIY-YIG nuclease family protein [Methylotenera sp.]|nr:GIY-YIG nuclease family protein [Methylotenera sp.]
MSYYVYIMANKPNGVVYIGVTNDLIRRVYEHKHHLAKGFTEQYNLDKLVWFEQTEDVTSAIAKEKQLKNWHRQWKINLIEKDNPNWQDLYNEIVG